MVRRVYLGLLLAGLVVVGMTIYLIMNSSKNVNTVDHSNQISTLRYVAIGDSYTIGNGVTSDERWPNLLTNHLKENGIDISLVGNPAVSGYTVQDAIEDEVLRLRQLKPDFVTLLIGANDSFGGGDPDLFKTRLNTLIDKIEESLSQKDNIVLVTIPDYTVSPAAKDFESTAKKRAQDLILQYNQIIKEIATERGLKVADIFPVSQTMTGPEDYINDGLHPSGLGYQKWERVIYPVVESLITIKVP
jgi:lysophospholipase L1-like esterase